MKEFAMFHPCKPILRVFGHAIVVAGLAAAALFGPVSGPARAESHAESHAEAADGGVQDLAGRVVAKVGETEITFGHMIAMVSTLPAEMRERPANELFAGVLERLIQQEAIAQSVRQIDPLTRLQLENERRSLLASQVVNRIFDEIEVTDEALREAYRAKFENFTPKTEYNASHILVETEEEAKEIIEALEAGADFGEMARTRSIGPSGPSGGNLGWFARGRMVPDFQAAVEALEPGQTSAPVRTQFGWHVIRLNDVREPGVPQLEDVRDELENELRQRLFREKLQELITAVPTERMPLDGIDPMMLGDTSLVGEGSGN